MIFLCSICKKEKKGKSSSGICFKCREESHNKNVITLTKIPDDIDIEILKSYVEKDIKANLEYFSDKNCNLNVNKEKAEWMIHKSCANSKIIGNGNKPTDIQKEDYGMDIAVLCINGQYSNEKSLIQNFKTIGKDLDTQFTEEKYNDALKLFMYEYKEKHDKLKEYGIGKNYYLVFLCNKSNIYLICLDTNMDMCNNVKIKKITETSIMIDNFIDEKVGTVKLYKSKKRLELRICKEVLDNINCVKLY